MSAKDAEFEARMTAIGIPMAGPPAFVVVRLSRLQSLQSIYGDDHLVINKDAVLHRLNAENLRNMGMWDEARELTATPIPAEYNDLLDPDPKK